jgi:four helix bundle protein
LKNASETAQIKDMKKDLENRTKKFALAIIEFVSSLPRTREADVLANQVLRSGTSIGANYREANRGVSRADFANKIGTVQKEASETQYWLELILESSIRKPANGKQLHRESTELLAIFTSIGKKLKE